MSATFVPVALNEVSPPAVTELLAVTAARTNLPTCVLVKTNVALFAPAITLQLDANVAAAGAATEHAYQE